MLGVRRRLCIELAVFEQWGDARPSVSTLKRKRALRDRSQQRLAFLLRQFVAKHYRTSAGLALQQTHQRSWFGDGRTVRTLQLKEELLQIIWTGERNVVNRRNRMYVHHLVDIARLTFPATLLVKSNLRDLNCGVTSVHPVPEKNESPMP